MSKTFKWKFKCEKLKLGNISSWLDIGTLTIFIGYSAIATLAVFAHLLEFVPCFPWKLSMSLLTVIIHSIVEHLLV